MTKTTLSFALISALMFFSACTPDDSEENLPINQQITVSAEKPSVYPFEVARLIVDGTLTSGEYTGMIDGDIEVSISVMDNQIYFFVPDLSVGQHSLSFYIDDYEFLLDIEINEPENIPETGTYVNNTLENNTHIFTKNTALDSLLYQSGIITLDQLESNLQNAQARYTEVEEILNALSEEEKKEYDRIYAANKDWLNEFQEFVLSSNKSNCESLLIEGINAKNAGRINEANDLFLQYKLCEIENTNSDVFSSFIDKINQFLKQSQTEDSLKAGLNVDSPKFVGVAVGLIAIVVLDKIIWPIIENHMGVWSEEVLGEDITEGQKNSKNFSNGQKSALRTKVKFRAVDFSDENSGGIIGTFVGWVNKANEAIKRLLATKPEAEVRPLNLPSSNEILVYNRNMEVKVINNSDKVSLSSSQIVDDIWEVVFETDETESQEFTYEITYDDNRTQISKEFTATLEVEEPHPLIGKWKAIQIDDDIVGEWRYDFHPDCPDLETGGYLTVYDIMDFTINQGMIWSQKELSKDFSYENLIDCSYSNLTITIDSGEWVTSLIYTISGDQIIFEEEGEQISIDYTLLDQNTLIIYFLGDGLPFPSTYIRMED